METAVSNRTEKRSELEQRNAAKRRVYSPAVDLYRRDDKFHLYADIPGASEDTVDVSVEKNILTIKAVAEEQKVEGNLLYSEYGLGDYERSFRLSEEIDVENIEARVRNGVLELIIPVSQPSTRKIQVKSE